MTSAPSLAVALIGDQDLSSHAAAILQTPHLHLCAVSPSAQIPFDAGSVAGIADVPIIEDPQHLLGGQTEPQVLVICTTSDERSYWIRAGLAAQRWIVSPLARHLPPDPADASGGICFEAPLAWTATTQVAERAQTAGRISYVRATMKIPSDWLCGEGVLLRWGAWLPYLLQQAIGSIDLVQARTRSYQTGPAEDHALALISFTNGTEGHIEIDALGDQAQWQIEMNGEKGAVQCGGDLRLDRSQGLVALYRNVGRAVGPAGHPSPSVGLQQARETLFLSHWIQQSARQEISLTRREARRG